MVLVHGSSGHALGCLPRTDSSRGLFLGLAAADWKTDIFGQLFTSPPPPMCPMITPLLHTATLSPDCLLDTGGNSYSHPSAGLPESFCRTAFPLSVLGFNTPLFPHPPPGCSRLLESILSPSQKLGRFAPHVVADMATTSHRREEGVVSEVRTSLWWVAQNCWIAGGPSQP